MEPVLCPAIIFCDGTIKEEGTGKFTIVGSFQFFTAQQFPLLVPGFCVMVMLDNLEAGLKELKVTVRLESPDSGHILASALANITLHQGYDPRGSLDIPFRFPSVSFPSAGTFQAVVLVNNEVVGARRLLIRSFTASQPSSS